MPNYGKPKRGLKLVPGLTIAIEPMVNVGSPATRTLPDKWTVVTVDGSRSAHFEHTVAITESGPRVLTAAVSGLTRPAVPAVSWSRELATLTSADAQSPDPALATSGRSPLSSR